jgi:radical SAM protein with 4Fe4S-binding SPASM domain
MKKRFKKIYVEITNICNLNCSFCDRTIKSKKEMTIEEFKQVIDKIKEFTDYIYLHVQGEPFLHSNLEKVLDVCDGNNIKVNITTNGTLLHKYVEMLKSKKCVRQINVSLHSENNMDDYYESVIDSCKKLSSRIYISYRIWNLNTLKITKELEDIIRHLKEKYNIDEEIEKRLLKEKSVKIDFNTFVDKDNLFTWPKLDNDIDTEGFCYGLKTHLGILSDGTVVPCCLDRNGEIKLGNIFEEDLEDILNKKETIEIIEGFKNNKAIHPLCRKCDFRKRFG